MPPFDAKISVALSADQDAYRPGDAITLHTRIEAEEAVEVRGARVELIGRLRYRYREQEWDRKDDRYETTTKTDSDELTLTDSILGPETISAAEPIERWVRFMVPRDATPSGDGSIIDVTWLARATVDVPRRRDANAEVPLSIQSPLEAYAARAETPMMTEAEATRLSLDFPSRHVAAGQPIEGMILVEARENLSVRAIRIELVRQEEVTRELGMTASETVVETKIAGDTEFYAGEHRNFAFTVAVPADAMPGSETPITSVRWFLRAVLDRTLRGDERISVELNLYNAPSE